MLKNLTSTQYKNFISLFNENEELAIHIIKSKFEIALDLPIKSLLLIKSEWVAKLKSLINDKISLIEILWIINQIDSSNIGNLTKYNIENIYQFFIQYLDFSNKQIKIEWGKGNYDNVEKNLYEHYKKHVLSEDEHEIWKKILSNITKEEYQKYAINSFYEMQNIVLHTNGRQVYISGFKDKIFIVGKYENFIFTISSCYYVEIGEKNGRLKSAIFCLKNW